MKSLLSSLIRDLVNATTEGPRWLILDGDIDPMWIESLNSVMDDNRVLTLASRERISLTASMRLIFEVSTLERATPATVSRGGVLYLDSADVGWNPYVVSWIERRSVQSEKANLIIFFDKYVPPCLEAMTKRFKTVLPIADICYVQTLCCLLECFLTPENTPPDSRTSCTSYTLSSAASGRSDPVLTWELEQTDAWSSPTGFSVNSNQSSSPYPALNPRPRTGPTLSQSSTITSTPRDSTRGAGKCRSSNRLSMFHCRTL
ncbi:dynein heavy chain 17, axonemal [Caerostris extrusa]|uniref:Dynein heavy chain 17, axonemal n=1 Tax=Caerostris extrusa TaxID=172846 RepID=A0AAV4V774_CAEEX|nr:dynein heavy chain 17, axonemal [Caerostris extrusa]